MTDQAQPDSGSLGIRRGLAIACVVVGAALALALMLRAGHPPLFLRVLFTGWVLSPFVALVLAHITSKRRAFPPRARLYVITLVISLGSPVFYGGIVPMPPGSRPAFVFLVVPFGSWLLLAIAALLSRLAARRLSPRAAGV